MNLSVGGASPQGGAQISNFRLQESRESLAACVPTRVPTVLVAFYRSSCSVVVRS